MKNRNANFIALLSNPTLKLFGKIMLMISFMAVSQSVFAAGGDDLLAGTTTQALATINGSGRYWVYIIDAAISLGAFAKTKNPFVFFSVLGVALFITVIVKMAGGS